MTSEKKPKYKVRTIKKFLRSEDEIYAYPDGSSWDVKSSSDPELVYMVYNSLNEGWLCDCMWFTIHLNLNPPHPECKHINKVKEKYKV